MKFLILILKGISKPFLLSLDLLARIGTSTVKIIVLYPQSWALFSKSTTKSSSWPMYNWNQARPLDNSYIFSKLVEAAIDEQIGILLSIASFASIVSAFGQVRLHIPIGAKPNGKPYSVSRNLVFRDLSSTFINTLGSSLIFSYALLLLIDRNSFPEAPSTKSKTSFGNRHFANSLASSILKIFWLG